MQQRFLHRGGDGAVSSLGAEQWQNCRVMLDICKAKENSPEMKKQSARLSDFLEKVNQLERPSRSELMVIGKSLGVKVTNKKFKLLESEMLWRKIKRACLQQVKSLHVSNSGVEHPAVAQML